MDKVLLLEELEKSDEVAMLVRALPVKRTAEDLTSEVFYKTAANSNDHERGPVRGLAAADRRECRHRSFAAHVPGTSEPKEPGANPDQHTIEHRSRLFRLVEQLLKSQRWFIA